MRPRAADGTTSPAPATRQRTPPPAHRGRLPPPRAHGTRTCVVRTVAIAVAVAAASLPGRRAPADEAGPPPAPFVGSDACGACHPDEFAQWRATAHARADRSLGARAGDRRCQGCHTTGTAPAGRPAFAGVGCEACHGAGGGYAADDIMRDRPLARALGLRDLSTPQARAAVCAACHRDGLRIARFDPDAAWQRIAHGASTEARR